MTTSFLSSDKKRCSEDYDEPPLLECRQLRWKLCVFCSDDSAETNTLSGSRTCPASEEDCAYVTCSNCKSVACSTCIEDFTRYIREDLSLDLETSLTDRSLGALSMMSAALMPRGNGVTQVCTCCVFKKDRVCTIKSDVTTPPRPPPFTCPNPELTSNATVKRFWRKNKLLMPGDRDELDMLHCYHDQKESRRLFAHCRPKTTLCKVNRSRLKKGHPAIKRNPYAGGMVVPMFGVLFQPDANEAIWRCDHMCLAASAIDGTPGVMHGVLSHSSAQSAFDYITCRDIKPKVIEDMGEVIDLDVSSPECEANIVSRRVHVIVLTQQVSDAEIKRRNYCGQNNFSVDFVTELLLFGGDYMREDVAATIVLGDFGLEGKSLPPKCLFVAWHGMLANEERNLVKKQLMAEELYSAVRSLAGKGGYELRRFGGSSGLTDNVTDKNMLHALAVSTGILPRKSWGMLLIRSTTKYYLVYRKVARSSGIRGICHAVYSPPRDGGQFSMPDICILRYPVLAEMTYQKMMALQLMCAYSKFRVGSGMKAVAQGRMQKQLFN